MCCGPIVWPAHSGMDGGPMRTNGFERPFHPLQLLSWVVFGLDVLIFCIFGIPLIETAVAKVLVAVCYLASVVVLVLAAVRATGCDPSDPHVRNQDTGFQEREALPYCTTCNSPVYPRSKHCRACNKCVKVFDHHCMWLNNCIGEANYRAFAMCIGAVAVMTGIVLDICVYLIIDFIVNEEGFNSRLEDNPIFGGLPEEAAVALLGFLVAVNLPLCVLDMQLIILHIFLARQQITTYEYIINKRAAEADESEEKQRQILPRCMDWIVYRSRRHRARKSDNIDNSEQPSALGQRS